jgi:hypothetical protein
MRKARHNRIGFDQLSSHLVDLACSRVEEQGGFAPFAGCVAADGKIKHLDVDAQTEPAQALEELKNKIRTLGSEIGMVLVSTSIVDPRTSTVTDAIVFTSESSQGVMVRGFLPYQKTSGEVVFGKHYISPLAAFFSDSLDLPIFDAA